MSVGAKAERVLKLLLGLRHPRVAARLAGHGFTQEDLDEGWLLLRAVAGERLNAPVPAAAPPRPDDLRQLDALENLWFPIAGAALKRHYPRIHERVFANLSQTEGLEVTLSVGTFLRRLEALEGEGASPEDIAARALLERRGLTAGVIAQATRLIEVLGSVQPMPEPAPEEAAAALAEAEEALWAYYLEWSTIARKAITDGRLLRRLGFGGGRRAARRGDAADEVDEGEEVAAEGGDAGEGEGG